MAFADDVLLGRIPRTGNAPFGQRDGKLVALSDCTDGHCRCGVQPQTLWEKEVLLIRKTIKPPPIEPGYRYRVVVGGSTHVNVGEGYAIYLDGKKLAESPRGVAKREGGRPRGGLVYMDVMPDLTDGNVTIGVVSFLNYRTPRVDNLPPNGHLSVWLQKQKLPPVK